MPTRTRPTRFSFIEPEPAYIPLAGAKEEEWEAPLFPVGGGDPAGILVTCCDVGTAAPGARVPCTDNSSSNTRSNRYSVATCLGSLAIACGVLVVVMCCLGDAPMPGASSPEVTAAGAADWPQAMIDGFDDMQIAMELSKQKAPATQASFAATGAAAAGSTVSYLGVHLPKASHADLGMSPVLQQLANSWAHISREVTGHGNEQLSSTSFEADHTDPAPQPSLGHVTDDQTAQAVLESDYSTIATAVQASAVGGDHPGIVTAASGPLDMPGGAQASLDMTGNGAATPSNTAAGAETHTTPAAAAAAGAPAPVVTAAEAAGEGNSQEETEEEQLQPAAATSTDVLPSIQQEAALIATDPATAAGRQQQAQQQEAGKAADVLQDAGLEGALTEATLMEEPTTTR